MRRSLLALMAIVAVGPAVAQDDPQTPFPDQRLPAPNRTIPEQVYPCNPGNYVPSPELGLPDVPPAVDCGEVIVPPKGLDPEIKEAPPGRNTGTLRVIPPSAIEPQTAQ